MAETSLGEAIALGTLSTVKTQNPFGGLQQAVQRKQQIDFAKEQQKAKQEADKQRKMDYLMSRIKPVDGKTTVWNAEGMQRDSAEYIYNSMEAAKKNDISGSFLANQNYETKASKRQAVDENIRGINQHAKSGGYVPKEALDAINKGDRSALESYIKNNPYQNVIQYDKESDSPILNPIKDVEKNDVYKQAVGLLDKFYEPTTEKRRFGDNYQVKVTLNPEARREAAKGLLTHESLVGKTLAERPREVDSELAAINTNPENAKLNVEEKKLLALQNIFDKDLEAFSQRWVNADKDAPRSGGANLDIDFKNQGGGASAMVIKRPITVNGKLQSRDFKLPPAPQYGFKTVTVLNTNGDDYRNLDGGKPMKGQSVQESQVGVATPIAYATKRLRDKSTGDILEVGDIIDEKRLQTAIDNDAVEWQASFPIIGKTKNKKGKTTDFSAVVPVAKLSSAVLLSQSKDDAPGTRDQIQKAIDDANSRNEEVRSKIRRKSLQSPPTASNKRKITGF